MFTIQAKSLLRSSASISSSSSSLLSTGAEGDGVYAGGKHEVTFDGAPGGGWWTGKAGGGADGKAVGGADGKAGGGADGKAVGGAEGTGICG